MPYAITRLLATTALIILPYYADDAAVFDDIDTACRFDIDDTCYTLHDIFRLAPLIALIIARHSAMLSILPFDTTPDAVTTTLAYVTTRLPLTHTLRHVLRCCQSIHTCYAITLRYYCRCYAEMLLP